MSLPPGPVVGSPRKARRRVPREMSCMGLDVETTTTRGGSAARAPTTSSAQIHAARRATIRRFETGVFMSPPPEGPGELRDELRERVFEERPGRDVAEGGMDVLHLEDHAGRDADVEPSLEDGRGARPHEHRTRAGVVIGEDPVG